MAFEVFGRYPDTVALSGADHIRVRARGDGNCLFHAAGHGLIVLGKLGVDDFDHARFRAHVVDFVAAHAKDTDDLGFKFRDGLGIARNQRDVVSEQQGRQIDRLVANLRRLRAWAGEACITAIEQLYEVEIEVYDTHGGDDALGVPYYATSGPRETKLRLCICMLGHTPYHYDLYLPEDSYDAERDDIGGAHVEPESKPKSSGKSAPPPKSGWIKQSAKEPWAYHLMAEGLQLFGPAIGPRQFHFSRAIIEGELDDAPRRLSVALGSQKNSVSTTAAILAVHLRNASSDDELELLSISRRAASEDLEEAIWEHLQLPLARVDSGSASATHLPDLSHTTLIVDTERGSDEQPGTLYLRLYRRAKGLLATKQGISDDGLVAEYELSLAKVEAEELDSPARCRYALELAKLLPKQLISLLRSDASPYQLVVAGTEDFTASRCAWTHFHVPSDWDVNIAETFATVPVLMLGDSPTLLGELGVDAELADRQERESFAMSEEAETALRQVLASAGLGSIDTNACNYLLEVEEGEWYLSTSWASMACLELDEDGRYCLTALYWSGGKRHAYIVDAADLAKPTARRERTRALAEVLELVGPAGFALRNHGSKLAVAAQAIEELDADNTLFLNSVRNVPDSREKRDLLNTEARKYRDARRNYLQQCRTSYNNCRDAINNMLAGMGPHTVTLHEHRLTTYRVTLTELPLPTWNNDAWDERAQTIAHFKTQVEEFSARLHAARDRVAQRGLALDYEEVEGVKDFEIGPGKHLAPGLDWKRHVFDPPLRLTHAVTTGISSCAGGLSFTTEKKRPRQVFLWHIDAKLSIPMLCEYERLWPGGKGAPQLRSLALLNPSTWELNKYRPDNIYPATVVEACETVFFARSAHWYVDSPTVAGCDLFGIDVQEAETLDWVFTYDIDKRISSLQSWKSVEKGGEDLPVIRAHFLADLYGTYRYDDRSPASDDEMHAYIALLENSGMQVEIKQDKLKRFNKACRVPAVNSAVFDTLAEQAEPLLTVECIYAGERGDWELAVAPSERWTPGTTT
jgi:hypothetical protein